MDFWAAVQELYDEKQRLDKAIKILEDLAAGAATEPASRRGRKNMPEQERLEVSERMKRYWASRRKEQPKS